MISPLLANLALDGLEGQLRQRFRKKRGEVPSTGVMLVRYADDFIITARSKELLEGQIRPFLEQFLAERGLKLSPEKTVITHIDHGFDFLGQNLRRFNGKLIIRPSKKNTQAFLDKVRRTLRSQRQAPAGNLIDQLNRIIWGWANYHRQVCSSQTYHRVDHVIFWWLWKWARRRHPHKGARWVRQKYFHTVGNYHWVFSGEIQQPDGRRSPVHLCYAHTMKIRRHRKIRAEANPYDRKWDVYFEHRYA